MTVPSGDRSQGRLSGGRTVREKPINQSGGIVLLDQARFELASAEREFSPVLRYVPLHHRPKATTVSSGKD
jgi:hypothetical protein